MAGESSDRIVYLDPVDPQNRQHHDGAGYATDYDRGPRLHKSAGSGNGDQGGNSAVAGHADVWFAHDDPGGEHGAKHTRGRGQVSGNRNVGEAEVHGAQGAARVKTEPAKPEDDHTQEGESHAVPGDGPDGPVLAILADPRSQRDGSHQCGRCAGTEARQVWQGPVSYTHLT